VTIFELLREGYGVEDIALKIGRPVADVRRVVENARRSGEIRKNLGLPPQRKIEGEGPGHVGAFDE
jgi:hypothetical protein